MSIQDSVIALYKSGAKRIVLDELKARPQVVESRGSAAIENYDIGESAIIRDEIITVYSDLIITEDGAFEKPAGWPSNGDYPAGTPIPSPLPSSLLNNNGTLQLDVGVQYYQQRRVHLVVFLQGTTLVEDRLLVPMAEPFSGYYHGITDNSGDGSVAMSLMAKPNLTGVAAARLAELLANNITQDPL